MKLHYRDKDFRFTKSSSTSSSRGATLKGAGLPCLSAQGKKCLLTSARETHAHFIRWLRPPFAQKKSPGSKSSNSCTHTRYTQIFAAASAAARERRPRVAVRFLLAPHFNATGNTQSPHNGDRIRSQERSISQVYYNNFMCAEIYEGSKFMALHYIYNLYRAKSVKKDKVSISQLYVTSVWYASISIFVIEVQWCVGKYEACDIFLYVAAFFSRSIDTREIMNTKKNCQEVCSNNNLLLAFF